MKLIFLDAVQDFGGSQKSTLNLIKNMSSEEGYEILYVDFWGTDPILIDNLKKYSINYKILQKREKPIIIRDSGNVFFFLINLTSFFFNVISLKKRFSKLTSDFQPDIVIVNNIKSASILKNKQKVKSALFVRTWFANQKLSRFKKCSLRKIDHFISVSNATRHALYTKGIANLDEIHVLPNAITINKSYSELKNPINKIRILNCGGYIKTKGIHHTLEIATELKKRNVSFEINVVGAIYKGIHSQQYFNELELYIKNRGLKDCVFLHQNITNVEPFYENTDILIHPTYSEGLPRVIMEAMAYSVPVIANSVGGVHDYILDGYTGFLAGFSDIDKFVDRIILLKSDLDLYNYISFNAYSLIEKTYNYNVQKENLNYLFNKMK